MPVACGPSLLPQISEDYDPKQSKAKIKKNPLRDQEEYTPGRRKGAP
jgi:hypothetical protein